MKLTNLHPRAERLIYDSGDVKALSELLSEGLASLNEANEASPLSPRNTNHVARASTSGQNNTRDISSRLPFYVGIVVYTRVNVPFNGPVKEFPTVIEHNPQEHSDG